MRVRALKRYDDAFREQAIALLERTDRRVGEVADSLGMPSATLRYWYTQEMTRRRRGKPKAAVSASSASVTPPTETLQQKLQRLEREIAALRKENEDLKLDRDILKKAAAFFAKESE